MTCLGGAGGRFSLLWIFTFMLVFEAFMMVYRILRLMRNLYVEKHILQLAKALTVKMTHCIDQ